MACPLRSLKAEIDLRARPMTGSWPVICPSSALAESRSLMFWMASPAPMFRTIFSRRGTAILFFIPSSLWSSETISFLYFSYRRLIASPSLLFLQAQLALLADPDTAAVLERLLLHPDALPALRAEEHDVGNGEGRLLLHDPPLDIAAAVGTDELLDEVDLLDNDPVFLGQDHQDLTGFALVFSLPDDDHVSLFQPQSAHQRTSGVSETIFMNFLSRSSLPTGPNTRVPTGSPALFVITAALSSTPLYEPDV